MACFLCLFIFSFLNFRQIELEQFGWEPIAEGISYREFFLPDPNHVYVTRLDRSVDAASIETSLANGVLGGGVEALSAQVERYDESLAYWDSAWRGRFQVVAAINGGFFDPNSGDLLSGFIQSGWYARRFEDRQTVGGFAWRFDRRALIVECVVQPPGKQRVVLLETNRSIVFDGINTSRGADQIIIYTPQIGAETPPAEPDQIGIEILAELGSPLTALGSSKPVNGTVRALQNSLGGMNLPFDHIVLSATGKAADLITGNFPPGTRIGVEFEIRHLDQGCRKEKDDDLYGVSAATAGGAVFLRAGVVTPLNDLGAVLRNPRTAVAMNDRYVYFIVVDGRDKLNSLGMSMVELGFFTKLRLGANWAVALDGGGSSTMVVNGEVVNHPNSETVVGAKPEKTPRGVANGLMMVVLAPEQRSTRFRPGDSVSVGAAGDANLRAGPGTNFPVQDVLAAGSTGAVNEHQLNGVYANGNYWWKAAFGERVGWVSETVLTTEQ